MVYLLCIKFFPNIYTSDLRHTHLRSCRNESAFERPQSAHLHSFHFPQERSCIRLSARMHAGKMFRIPNEHRGLRSSIWIGSFLHALSRQSLICHIRCTHLESLLDHPLRPVMFCLNFFSHSPKCICIKNNTAIRSLTLIHLFDELTRANKDAILFGISYAPITVFRLYIRFLEL